MIRCAICGYELDDDESHCRDCQRASSSGAARGSAKPDIYVFHRAEGFYVLELKDDVDAIRNAECNPGTLKVTTKSGDPVWPNDQAHAPRI